ncbi:MAG: hypothetical protein FD165_2462 [Gammaproteobacteria bacterium]|nr:MAG: hypothetical protein FD165_2462 [Gammaproteobacteria bacterium]TND02951.1 MAG: hypothetical protein FD120_2020 [Gammaproteobacteria bacterium]
MAHFIIRTGVVLGVLLLASCSRSHDVTVLLESGQCGRQLTSAALDWLTTPAQLERLIQYINKHKAGGAMLIGGPFDSSPEVLPVVDFGRSGVLLVEMGRRPTGGYRLGLVENSLAVRDGIAQLSVDWQEPGDDDVVTQVVTSPCLLLALPHAGYHEIVVVDQHEQPRARLPLR